MIGDDTRPRDDADSESTDSVVEWIISSLVALVAVGGVIAIATALLLFFPGSNGLDAAEVDEILREESTVVDTTVVSNGVVGDSTVTTTTPEAAASSAPPVTSPTSVLATQVEAPVERIIAYRVVRGDTLSLIGDAYGVDWRRLAVLNELPDPNFLSIGLVLQVPVVDELGGIAAFTEPSLLGLHAVFDGEATSANLPSELLKAVLWVQTGWGTESGGGDVAVLSTEAQGLVADVTGADPNLDSPEGTIQAAAAYLGDLLAQAEGDASAAAAGFFEGVISTRDIEWSQSTVDLVAEMLRVRPAFVEE